jgi:transcriptional regulator with XRE-family HTH domain
MTAPHSCYEELAAQRRDSGQYRAGYAEAGRTFLIGQAVRERRLALGLSQAGLAARAGMTQPALSRLEAGGAVPTIPLLERISAALDADLIVKIAPHAACAGAHRSPTTPHPGGVLRQAHRLNGTTPHTSARLLSRCQRFLEQQQCRCAGLTPLTP